MGWDSVRTPILGYGTDNVGTVEQALDLAIVQQPVPPTAAALNLLTNGSFEVADGWTVGPGWTVPFASATAQHEAHVARLVANGSPGELVSAPVPVVVAEDSYIVNFYARLVAHTTGSARVVLRSYDVTNALLDEHLLVEIGSEYATEDLLGFWLGVSKQFAPTAEEEADDVLSEEADHVRLVFTADDAVLTFEVDSAQIGRGWLETTFGPAPNENIDGSAILRGTIPPEALDTTPPAVPTGLALTSDAVLGADGTAISRVYASLVHPLDTDYAGCEIQITGNYDQSDPADPATRTPLWVWARTLNLPADGDRVTLEPAIGGAPYWARARSVDATGNRSAFSPVVLLPAAIDADAPPIPVINQTVRGFKSVGLWWDPVAADDLSHYEVRWRKRPEVVVIEGSPPDITVQEWTLVRTKATVVVATNLETSDAGDPESSPGVPNPEYPEWTYYTFQVRAVDLTGNVREGRTLNVLLAADALAAAETVDVADGRGILPGSSVLFDGDATQYSVRAVAMTGPTAATLTLLPALAGPLAVGTAGVSAFTSFVPLAAAAYVDAGWSVTVIDYPVLVGQPDIAANSILSNMIVAGEITAGKLGVGVINALNLFVEGVIEGFAIHTETIDATKIAVTGLNAEQIKAGTLTLGGIPPEPEQRTYPESLLVLDEQDRPIARVGRLTNVPDDVPAEATGVLLLDPDHPQRKVLWANGVMSFTDDNWAHTGVAIDGRGIVADSILIGTSPGGHNSIPNPSFERTPVIGAPETKIWTTNADWETHLTGAININDSGSADTLQMTTVAY